MAVHILYLLFWIAGVFAAKPLNHEVCVASCYYALLNIKYESQNKTEEKLCSNPLRITSTYYCTSIHCKENDLEPGLTWWAGTCKPAKKKITLKNYEAAIANTTSESLTKLPTVNETAKTVMKQPAVPSEESWELVYSSVHGYVTMRSYHNSVRWIPYGFWAIVMLFGVANNIWNKLSSSHGRKSASNSKATDEAASPPAKASPGVEKWWKSRILLAPTFRYHHHQPIGWFIIPLRFQTLIMLAYICLHIGVVSAHYPVFDGNYYYKTAKVQALRYFADRLGALNASIIPLIFLFGGRANPLIFLTGWSYRTFSLFHRLIATILVVEGIVHGSVFSAYYVDSSGPSGYRDELRTDLVFRYGIMMLTALGISLAMASGYVRAKAYELFKVTHVVMAAIFLAAFYNHVKGQFKGYYDVWTWATVGIWAGDRVLRLGRHLMLNYKSFVGKDMRALASYSEETGMIRLQVHPSMVYRANGPGTYYYVYFPGWRFWESHPFSLAGCSDWTAEAPLATSSVDEKNNAASPRVTDVTSDKNETHLTFLIRPRNGMTRRLKEKLVRQGSSQPLRLRVLLEGPYGSPARLAPFDNILFVAGGSGITAVLPYVHNFLRQAENTKSPSRLRLSWVARTEGFIRDVLANDLNISGEPGSCLLEKEFFVTSGSESPVSSDLVGDNDGEHPPETERFSYSKPNVNALVETFVGEAVGRTAVFVCGPAQMADQTRAAVISQIKQGRDVDLFEEMYGW